MKEKESTRPEAYPKPTTTDRQLQNQPEYIDQQPNSFEEGISNVSVNTDRGHNNQERSQSEGEDI